PRGSCCFQSPVDCESVADVYARGRSKGGYSNQTVRGEVVRNIELHVVDKDRRGVVWADVDLLDGQARNIVNRTGVRKPPEVGVSVEIGVRPSSQFAGLLHRPPAGPTHHRSVMGARRPSNASTWGSTRGRPLRRCPFLGWNNSIKVSSRYIGRYLLNNENK